MPTGKYVHGPKIRAHCQRIGRQFGLYDDALFHTEVTGLTWDEARTLRGRHRRTGLHAGLLQQRGQDSGAFLGRGYPHGPSAYFAYIDKWRASGTFDGLEFR